MARFYEFVNRYQREHGYEIDEAALRQEIELRVGGWHRQVSEAAWKIIRHRVSLAYNILDFLKQTGR